MTRLHEERREAHYRELSGHSERLDELDFHLAREQEWGRRNFLDLMNLQGVASAGRISLGFAFEESMKGINRWMYNELRRNFERTDQRSVLRLRRDAAVERCTALCARSGAHDMDAGQSLIQALRAFPGDEALLALVRDHAQRLGIDIPAPLRALRKVREFRDPVHALISATCAVPDGFWTGNRKGVIRRFDSGGGLLEEHAPQTEHVEKIFTDAEGRVWVCDPLARAVAVMAPGQGVLARIDMADRLTATRSGLSGCAGALGIILGAYDEDHDRTTLFKVGDEFSLSAFFSAPGHIFITQAGCGLYAIEGYSQQVCRILPDQGRLFALPRSGMTKPTRVTRFDDDHLLFFGKDSLAVHSLDGQEVLCTSLMRHSEGCSILADVERDAAARIFCLANTNEPVVHVVEAVA